MDYFKQPDAWFWAHDIEPAHIANSLLLPGTQLVRLASYGSATRLRFASLSYYSPQPPTNFRLDIEAARLEETYRSLGAQAISIDSYGGLEKIHFALVLEAANPELETSIHKDLTEIEVQQYLESGYQILDFTTYQQPTGRRFAIIAAKSSAPSCYWFAGLSEKELGKVLKKARVKPVRLRGYHEGTTQYFAAIAVADQSGTEACVWYTGLDANGVARKLEKHKAYPLDLDPYKEQDALYFNVIMCKEK